MWWCQETQAHRNRGKCCHTNAQSRTAPTSAPAPVVTPVAPLTKVHISPVLPDIKPLVDSSPTGMSAAQLAADAITRVQSTGLQTLEANHAQWWTNSFWSASITSVPDAIFESFHAMQMYKVGSATRCDSDDNCWAMDLAMPWYVLPAATSPTLLLSLATALLLRPPFSPP